MIEMKLERNDKKLILFAIYIASMILVNILGGKISYLFIPEFRISAGIVLMPILCCVCDIYQECFGKKEADKMVNISLGMLIFMILVQKICVMLPAHKTYPFNEEFKAIFTSSIRMSIASFTSFFIAQKIDVLLFFLFRKLTNEKYLFFRNNISTFVSQFFDTCVFMFGAFYKMNPKYTASYVFSLILPYWGFKILFSFLNTPFCYLGRWWIGIEDKEELQ